jgi:hypothetical protein
MLPFNTSAFSNLLGAPDRTAQQKALISPFEEFDGKAEDVTQHISCFTQCCDETGVIEDFNFIISENSPPCDFDLSSPLEKAAWLSDSHHFTHGNFLIDASQATIEKVQAARDKIRTNLQQFTSPPDPKTMPLALKQLVSFQDRQWLYVLLMIVWSAGMKTLMLRYQTLHDQDGVVLWYCFLQHFAGTTIENLIKGYSQLSETKLQLHLFQDNILNFTNAVHLPIRRLMKATEAQSFQHFLTVFHHCMDASNEEFHAFVIALYTDYRNGGSTKNLTLLELLDKLDAEYNRINNLGRWIKKEDPQVLALTTTFSNLQSQLSTIKGQYGSLQALIAKSTTPTPITPLPTTVKLQKPPPKQSSDPEITTFQDIVCKWCDKFFGGSWNRTHISSEHVSGIGKRNRRHQKLTNNDDANNTTPTNNNNNNNNNSPQAHLAQSSSSDNNNNSTSDSSSPIEANIATASLSLVFI